MQDFAPFIPELLGAAQDPQTPGRKGRRASVSSASICLLLFNFLLLLKNLLTSLIPFKDTNILSLLYRNYINFHVNFNLNAYLLSL